MKKRLLFVLTSLFFVAAQAFAQQQTVTGKITSEQGTPLSGVTVTVKGTTTRAVTTDNGTFTILAAPGQTLQFRMEAFNFLNHPVWGLPNASVTSSNYGRITSTTGSMRQMQFALKYVF